jgi:hypothetical protein
LSTGEVDGRVVGVGRGVRFGGTGSTTTGPCMNVGPGWSGARPPKAIAFAPAGFSLVGRTLVPVPLVGRGVGLAVGLGVALGVTVGGGAISVVCG